MPSSQERVTAIIVNQLGVDISKVQPEANFQNDLGADSIDIVELMMEFEKEFDISIPSEVSAQLETVQQVIEYLTPHTK